MNDRMKENDQKECRREEEDKKKRNVTESDE